MFQKLYLTLQKASKEWLLGAFSLTAAFDVSEYGTSREWRAGILDLRAALEVLFYISLTE